MTQYLSDILHQQTGHSWPQTPKQWLKIMTQLRPLHCAVVTDRVAWID